MLTKAKIQKTLNRLPEQFSIDELIEQLIFIEKVEEGIIQSDKKQIVSNENVKTIIDSWSK